MLRFGDNKGKESICYRVIEDILDFFEKKFRLDQETDSILLDWVL